jgi:hypothetical protein
MGSFSAPWLASKLLFNLHQPRETVNMGIIAHKCRNQCLRFTHSEGAKEAVFLRGKNEAGDIIEGGDLAGHSMEGLGKKEET